MEIMLRIKIAIMLMLAAGLTSAQTAPTKTGASAAAPIELPEYQAGGPVRTVAGKLALKDGSMLFTDWPGCEGMLSAKRPRPPLEIRKQGQQEMIKWLNVWRATPEGKKQYPLLRFRKPVKVKADGSFAIEGVPAGQFVLTILAIEKPDEMLGRASREITMPEITEADAAKPLDIGKLEIMIPPTVKKGSAAPDFKFRTLDGKVLSLKDFRGNYVLLDFWATWCGPCVGEVPNFKATYDAYGKQGNFVMISLSLDDDIAAPRDYVQKNGIGWIQGFLGHWNSDPVTKAYGVQSIPSTFLIGPGGSVIAKGLRGEGMKDDIGKAIKKK